MKLKQHQKYLEELLANENERLQKLHNIVAESIKEEELLTESLSEQADNEKMKLGDRISFAVTRFVGSWAFVISFCIIFGSWIALNLIPASIENTGGEPVSKNVTNKPAERSRSA